MAAPNKTTLPPVTIGLPSGPVHCVVADCVRPLAVFNAMQVRVCLLPAVTTPAVEGLISTVTGDDGTADMKLMKIMFT